jgi:hypothetical protein
MERMQKREPEFSAPMTPPLHLGVSICLLGETVRYDGRSAPRSTPAMKVCGMCGV